MVLLNKCCCCNLQTGAIIIGWLGLATDIFSFVSITVSISRMAEIASERAFDAVFQTICMPMIAWFVVGIMADISLFWGAYKEQYLMLLPWMITSGINSILLIIVIVFRGVFGSLEEDFTSMLIFMGIPIAALQVYFWFAVLSLYQRFREDATLNKRLHQEEVGFIVQEPSAPNYLTKPPPYKVASLEC